MRAFWRAFHSQARRAPLKSAANAKWDYPAGRFHLWSHFRSHFRRRLVATHIAPTSLRTASRAAHRLL